MAQIINQIIYELKSEIMYVLCVNYKQNKYQ